MPIAVALLPPPPPVARPRPPDRRPPPERLPPERLPPERLPPERLPPERLPPPDLLPPERSPLRPAGRRLPLPERLREVGRLAMGRLLESEREVVSRYVRWAVRGPIPYNRAHGPCPRPRRRPSPALRPHRCVGARGLDDARRKLEDPRERGLLTELALGCVRRRGTLDAVLGAFSSRPVAKLNAAVRTALRLGLHQILFLDRVPRHSAVDEAVRWAKGHAGPKRAGFVNGVLRSIVRDLEGPGRRRRGLTARCPAGRRFGAPPSEDGVQGPGAGRAGLQCALPLAWRVRSGWHRRPARRAPAGR